MRVERYLIDAASRHPEKIALIVGDSPMNYGQLRTQALRLSYILHSSGVRRGDRVVLFLENSALAVASIFGTLMAGAIFIPVNASTKSRKLAYILNNCSAKALVTHSTFLPVAAEAIHASPSVVATLVDDLPDQTPVRGGVCLRRCIEAVPAREIAHGGIDTDLAMLIYTSGSTGLPKGVMITHMNIITASCSINEYLENTSEDVILDALPLSFDYGLYQVFLATNVGATVVLEKSFAYPGAILKTMLREQVTGFPLVPTMAAILLQMRDLQPGQFPRLRYITNTAAALPPAHIRRLQELFPETKIYSMYGLTECKRCTYLPPDQLSLRPDSVGKAIPNTEVYLVNDQGGPVEVSQVGELVIRGGHVMQGYWEDPLATDQALRPGPYPWQRVLHSGDLFRQDEEGYFYFVARKDDIIKTRGEKVSPKEVESVLYALPGIREAAVIGVPDPILGQAIKAFVAVTEAGGLTEREIIRHCSRHLEDYMVPRAVEFVQELPKTNSGKIRRKQVQAEATRESSDDQRRPET